MTKITSLLSLFVILVLAACANETEETNPDGAETEDMDHNHSEMNMSGSGEVPEQLEEAENPTYEVNSQAMIEADHMEGMNGAEATIVGAYDTTAYSVSYTQTNGGDRVTDHKWVIHEELEGVGEEPLEIGDEATINAAHMEGMDGATAEIDSAIDTTVYMVDFTLTTTGEEVTNHKWVTEDELSPIE
jgi:hypothetical protein